MRLDRQQRAAARAIDRPTLVSAGAGSGKTRVLVERYMGALARPDADVSRIVAVTFTELAAEEMKDRLRAEFAERAAAASDEQKRLWRARIADLAAAPISTIHGFCSRLLRRFAAEAGVDPAFTVDDELARLIRERAARAVLVRTVRGRDGSSRDVAALAAELGWERLVGTLVENEYDEAAAAWGPCAGGPDSLLRHWELRLAEAVEAAGRRAVSDPRIAEAAGVLGAHEAGGAGCKLDARRAELVELLAELRGAEPVEAAAMLPRIVALCNTSHAKTSLWDKGALAAVKATMVQLRELVGDDAETASLAIGELDARAAAMSCTFAALAARVHAEAEAAKRSRGVLGYDDLLRVARKLLLSDPSILRRAQLAASDVLIDELQDTDRVQMDILTAIAPPGRLPDGATPKQVPVLFAVGDPKQSIYRFRGADVTGFLRLLDGIGAQQHVPLSNTYRCSPELVDFHNFLFRRLLGPGRCDERMAYDRMVAVRGGNGGGDGPSVEILRSAPEAEKLSEPQPRRAEAEAIANRLRQIVDGGRPTVGDDAARPTWGDIAILLRAMTNVGVLEIALRERGIPYLVSSGGGFYGQQEIRDALTLLRVADRPDDRLAAFSLLRSPVVGLGDDTLLLLRDMPADWWLREWKAPEGLPAEERDRLDRCRVLLRDLRRGKDRSALGGFVQFAVSRSGLEAIWAGARGRSAQAVANLGKLRGLAQEYPGSLAEFIAHVDRLTAREEREAQSPADEEEAAGRVRIMSMHGAKGLEFPITVLADLGRSSRNAGPPVVVDGSLGPLLRPEAEEGGRADTVAWRLRKLAEERAEAEEDVRLLYVAATRARDYLLLSAARWYKYVVADSAAGRLRDALGVADLPPGEVRLDGGGRILVTDHAGIARARIVGRLGRKGPRPDGRTPLGAADPETLADVRRRVELVPTPWVDVSCGPLQRFDVTAVIDDYLVCPRRYAMKAERMGEDAPGDAVASEGELAPAERGTLVHELLAGWRSGRPAPGVDDARRVAGSLFGHWRGLAEADLGDAAALARAFIGSPDAEPLGAALRDLAEVELSLRLGSCVLTGVIDRLVEVAPSEYLIFDFKTDRDPRDATVEGHRKQVQLYAAALGRCSREPAIAAKLVYLRSGRRVDVDVSAVAVEAVMAEVESAASSIMRGEVERPIRCPDDGCPFKDTCRKEVGA